MTKFNVPIKIKNVFNIILRKCEIYLPVQITKEIINIM